MSVVFFAIGKDEEEIARSFSRWFSAVSDRVAPARPVERHGEVDRTVLIAPSRRTSYLKIKKGDASSKAKLKKRRSATTTDGKKKRTLREPPGHRGHGLDAQTARRDLGDERAEHGAERGTGEEDRKREKEERL